MHVIGTSISVGCDQGKIDVVAIDHQSRRCFHQPLAEAQLRLRVPGHRNKE